MSDTYFRIRLSNVNTPQEQEVSTFCFDHKALGLSEVLSFSQPDLTYDPSLISRRILDLDVFFEAKPSEDFFRELKAKFSGITYSTNEEESKDWLEEWKKGFVPFKLVGKTWIVPSWLEKPEEAQHEIKIDPGMAFGTGTHATTKMASYFVHKIATEHADQVKDWTLLDVGTGTAILAMLAEKMGFALITGIEIDPEARRKARENCELNQTQSVDITDQQLDEIRDQYDVVVANIIDGVLIRLQKDLMRATKDGGHLFLTGILQERDNLFFEKFIEAQPVKVIKRIQKDEWVGYWVQKGTQ
ncbi:50S ribosomal protein L11 methyltransferase [Pseudobdellovibrio exovorus]|uniref:Ribosomal protein L11 methyltransferase n=1 Tax=Pseudobdellovibrio exovorus JSS TaxID=1184267 RepID=M4VST4_9BACT|nr:50S ribosomal protein L11 methyltransferase [Pseudobdellovibrio exovorus]AGH96269.1 methylase for 50S ribosomal subunit protein L11 [Pseudobdellovibrio exovorus JSS]